MGELVGKDTLQGSGNMRKIWLLGKMQLGLNSARSNFK